MAILRMQNAAYCAYAHAALEKEREVMNNCLYSVCTCAGREKVMHLTAQS